MNKAMSTSRSSFDHTSTASVDDGAETAATTILEHMLDRGSGGGALVEASVDTWSDEAGRLSDGSAARLGASCLMRPMPGDRVLTWASNAVGPRWVIAILQRPAKDADAVLAVDRAVTLRSSRIRLSAESVQIGADTLLVSTRNYHTVTDTETESARIRVADVGTDIRRAKTADDNVSGTRMQRAGTWISNTVREARLKARTFLFD